MADDGDDLTNCSVCFDEYTETGDYIPRILPCFHTLCEECLGQLVQNDGLNCPECRVKHTAPNGKTSFPQNKYVLAHLKNRDRTIARPNGEMVENLRDVKNMIEEIVSFVEKLNVRSQFVLCVW